jgi:hypothetical protein
MASPFATFRKRQKLWMAITCLLAIIAFVFLPNMGSLLGRNREGQEDLVVVKTKKYGDLRLSDLRDMRSKKQKVRAVLTELMQAVVGDPSRAEKIVTSVFGSASDDQVIDTWLKVRRAQELGMVVSDETITRFLENWTQKRVPLDKIRVAIGRTPPVSDAQFYDLLRDELLAQRLVDTFKPSIRIGNEPIATPSQRWDWFNRVNRKAVIEAVPFAVANYVDEVKRPSDEVLKKFFEENKNALPDPTSPNSGFRRPQKVAIEYIKADVAQFAAKVSDAEVLKEYEDNKDEYDRIFKIPPPRRPANQQAPNQASNIKKADEPKPKPKADQNPAAKSPVVEPKKELTAPKETPKAEQKKPAADTKQTAPKGAAKAEPKEPNKTPDSKGASSATGRSPFMLTALQQGEKSADKPSKPPATSQTAVKPAPSKTETPAVKPEKPAAKQQKPATKEQQNPMVKTAAPEKTIAERIDELPDALKTSIRRRLALQRIQQVFDDLRKPVEEYQQDFRKYDSENIRLEHAKKKVPSPPSSLALEKLAKENGLSLDRTKLLTIWQAQDANISDVGTSMIGGGSVPVWAYVYQSPKYRSMVSLSGNAAYLCWKSEDVREFTPKFDDKGVHDEVLHSWKMVQARSLARKAAKSLADEANRVGKPLKEVLKSRPDLRVVLPPQFSWMTISQVAPTSTQRPQVRLSPVAGVPMAGENFMTTVFQLEPGQADVAFNNPETTAYVVRPSEFTHSYEVRWRLFLVDSFATYAAAGAPDEREVFRAWDKEIKEAAGFDWGPGHRTEQADETSRGGQRQQPTPADDED